MAKWMPSWMQQDDSEDKNKNKNKSDLPPELEETVKSVGELKEGMTALGKRLEGLDSITAYFEGEKKRREDEAAAALAAKNKKKDDDKDDDPSDIAARLLEDPKKTISELTQGSNNAIFMVRADQIRRQVFDDRAEEFPYYTGDIKKEVDALVQKQSLAFQNDPAALENAYYTVVGKKQKEIEEKKIKSRFASSAGANITGKSESKEDISFDVTPEIIKAARLSGMETDDYMKLLKKAAMAGEIEYV